MTFMALVAPKGAIFLFNSQTSVYLLFLAAQQQLTRPFAGAECMLNTSPCLPSCSRTSRCHQEALLLPLA